VAGAADRHGVYRVEDRPAPGPGQRFVEFDGESLAPGVVPGVRDAYPGFAEFPAGEFVTDHLPSEHLDLASLPAHRPEGRASGQRTAAFQRRGSTERDALHDSIFA